MQKPFPVAIALSDLHLTLTPPACRNDVDWMAAQARYLAQVKALAKSLNPIKPLPILCAGDIFDRWNVTPELINFALDHLPDGMYCVPGQHDLPSHRQDLMHRSGYGVLAKVGKIKDISGNCVITPGDLALYGFGWKDPLRPLSEEETDTQNKKAFVHIAVVHQYVWTLDKKFPGAPETSKLANIKKQLRGYDAAVFGDNHKSFLAWAGGCVVFNCGGFIRRKSDEIKYSPNVGVIYNDGSVAPHKLNTSLDKFHPTATQERPEGSFDMKLFIDNLQQLGEHGLDFRAAVIEYIKTHDLPPPVEEIIQAAIK